MTITKLKKNEIFVFGSNLNGAHAGGAALTAFKKFGAEMGIGEGITGRSYAFPTLDKNMQKVSENAFRKSVKKLYKTAKENPDNAFLLTKVGCGIAGFEESWVREQFTNAPENIVLPEDWREIVTKDSKVLYKFLRTGMKSEHGNMVWKVGKWYKEENIKICGRGFHASNTPLEAIGYVKGEIVAKVEVRGESIYEDDKSCHSEMRIVDARVWKKEDSVAFSIFASMQVIDNYEKLYPHDDRPRKAILAAQKWLENPTDKNAEAARSAADSAAYSAAYAAYSARSAAADSAADSAAYATYSARSAARSAADSAAYSARSAYSAYSARSAAYSARSAADSAAYSARSAYSAAYKEITSNINAWIIARIETLEKAV